MTTGEIAIRDAGTLATTDATEDAQELIRAWRLSLTNERTRRAYERDLASFIEWLAKRYPDVHLIAGVGRKQVDEFVRHSAEVEGRKPSTVARRLSTLASFYGYLLSEEQIDKSPVDRVKRPKVSDESNTVGLDAGQVDAMLSEAQKDGARSYALMMLLANNGTRVSEALEAKITDLGRHRVKDREHRTLRITRKGGKIVLVPLAPTTADAIDSYIGDRADGYIFVWSTGGQLQESDVYKLVNRLAKRAGIDIGKIGPHSLRHSFVTQLLDAEVPLHIVQDAAGHVDPRTTQRYNRARNNLDKHPTYLLASLRTSTDAE